MSILDRIHAHGAEVTRHRWSLTLRKGRLDAAALAWIKKNKAGLMRELWPAYDAWEERAAIIEYDGGFPRDDAEEAAYAEVAGTC